ncbi:helix-turn-helix transcriptional regulator [Enterobacter sp.]|jgi:transcriptional regulator with XRE-family HTH domain|uniref:helix-turn-helix domain-containing protein n=1 Tax=Enterobacter sp. TaxID=42895 RepID=UPI0012D13C43|nr:helix-turn-helix transcriptional regulator [Enterobacter sp.]MPS86790.1 XRE family transcriptional regulator [Enterobacter sp.]
MSDEQDNRKPGETLGLYLKNLRGSTTMSLRDVEEATEKEVSNAYLSQLENGKIAKPSPNVLHHLSRVYNVQYSVLMEKAGYISPNSSRDDKEKHGRAATFAIDNLSNDEEKELLKYLNYYRMQKGKQ